MKLRTAVPLVTALALAACSSSDETAPDTTGPTVSLSSPTAGDVTGSVTVSATASDAGGVVLVEFLAGGTVIGADTTAPYSINWNTAAETNGAYALTARATDGAGNVGTSSAVSVTVANTDVQAPSVAITVPGTGDLTGTVTLTATASDNVGVKSVVFLVDGNPVGFDHTAPYEFALNAHYLGRVSGTSFVGGSHVFSARAIDTSGNAAESTTVTRTVGNLPIVQVNANVTGNTTWSAANVYRLMNLVYVQAASGTTTLTIEPGTIVVGEFGSALAVTKTGRLVADGAAATPVAPIVFTSSKPYGDRRRGDWGGVVLLGAAVINTTDGGGGSNNIEGISASPETSYGGNDDAHDCGTLRYVRIEYAGYVFGTNNELNGLTLGGCGSGTTIDYIQVHKGLDDGIEFFGGTASMKHVVISWADDDGLDWDFGWRGKVQFLVVQQEPSAGDKGFEADNNGTNQDFTPRSDPTIYNATLVGSGKAAGVAPAQAGLSLKVGTAGHMYNMIVTRFSDAAVDVDSTSTVAQITAGALTLENNIVYGNAGSPASWGPDPDADGITDNTLFDVLAKNNRNVDPLLTSYLLEAPSYVPQASSPSLTGAATPPDDGFFDPTATFVGAIPDEAGDWTAGWTAYPNN